VVYQCALAQASEGAFTPYTMPVSSSSSVSPDTSAVVVLGIAGSSVVFCIGSAAPFLVSSFSCSTTSSLSIFRPNWFATVFSRNV